MGQSLVKNYVHLVFSTKNRNNDIPLSVEKNLYAYIGAILKSNDSEMISIGGTENHIHILFNLSKTKALSEIVKQVKASSSKWFKTQNGVQKSFAWQDGYAAFSVNPAEVDVVVTYLRNQKEHHKTKSFEHELLQFLKKYEVEYDEQYIWR